MHTETVSRLTEAFAGFFVPEADKDVAWASLLEALTDEGFENVTPDELSGVAIQHEGNPNRKLFASRLMVELLPESGEAHCFLGHAYRDNHRYAEALQEYDRAIECDIRYVKNVHHKNDIITYRLYKTELLIEIRQYGEAFVELLLAKKMLLDTGNQLEHLAKRIQESFEICIPFIAR